MTLEDDAYFYDEGLDYSVMGAKIAERMTRSGLRGLAGWPEITRAMLVQNAAHEQQRALMARSDWESRLKPIAASFGPRFTQNALHMLYHLHRFRAATGCAAETGGRVFEIGGGFGQMNAILRLLGFTGEYTMLDLPPMLALQKAYLEKCALAPAGNVFTSDWPETTGGTLIATWSLSEADLVTRQRALAAAGSFSRVLIAYQPTWHGRDNAAYFAVFRKLAGPGILWHDEAACDDSRYLFGTRGL